MSKRRHPRAKARRLAQARVDILWEQAKKEAESGKSELARQKMLSARKIAQRTRTKLPHHIRRRMCKCCGTILVPGDTCRIRVRHNRSKHVTVTCFACGAIRRYYI
ncbi:MAG: ribonuclease P Rpr2/Rpp21/SNM1 subunit [Candidatus Thorarchaeota archaeon]|jgi:ribonuclease P protein subunit RPR2